MERVEKRIGYNYGKVGLVENLREKFLLPGMVKGDMMGSFI